MVALTSEQLPDVIHDIEDVVTESYKHHMGYIPTAAKRSSRLTLEKYFGENCDVLPAGHLIAVPHGDPHLGHMWIGPSQIREDVAYIYSLYVHPDKRSQGIGRRMLAYAEKWAKKRGFTEIQLHVFATNTGAVELYVSSGYERVSSNMKKSLTAATAEPIRDWPDVMTTGRGRPAIISPVFGEPAVIARDIESAHRQGADMIEWRGDLSSDWERIRPILELASLPIIATVRTSQEGGDFDGDYSQALRELATWNIACIDVEIFRDGSAELMTLVRDSGKKVIGSYHCFDHTPTEAEMVRVLDAMDEAEVDIAKLSFMPLKGKDTRRQMKMGKRYKHRPLINISMGDKAAWSRLVPSAMGSVATFAAVRHGSAPGQLPISAVRTAVDSLV